MSKYSSFMEHNGMFIAKVANGLLLFLPVIMVVYWQLGVYDYSTDDGYSGVLIARFVGLFILLPVLVIAGLLLALAIKTHKKGLYAFTAVSIIYAILFHALLSMSIIAQRM